MRAFVKDYAWGEPYHINVEGEADFHIEADQAVYDLPPALVERFRAAQREMRAAADAITAHLKRTGQPKPWGMPEDDWAALPQEETQ
ncbi:hypothetical protein [Nonomuraea basaltis]|uniref:hypothetical protein n=1 Tax=Nonomuraea basaltis TaxID=2495887 RepID=UPI00110C402E|nr:hypothetical protein [Nonomuraea basaltis]TMS00157.1 hypothetical protein EJK15_03535 [Nonomuraea basaltis]